MSSGGGSCSCGSSCKCGSGCNCSSMYPDLGFSEKTSTKTIIAGVAPAMKIYNEGSEMSFVAENGCKCGSNCACDPCNCK
ncbi:metallothionein-like protein type 2 [Juglans regia]|uniref:Metallothionein-like protein n=1 Tax=Juglans regia TaxID=51240 RepID=A0A2I4EV53_JUGRE|nr:metallothionein-like protein type 2 [Juglans regia]